MKSRTSVAALAVSLAVLAGAAGCSKDAARKAGPSVSGEPTPTTTTTLAPTTTRRS